MTQLRHGPARDLMRLSQMLQARKHVGMTVVEIAGELGRSERTAKRLLATLSEIEPELAWHHDDGDRRKRWAIRRSRSSPPAVTADTLASLAGIGNLLRANGLDDYANLIADLRQQLAASQERRRLLAIDPDLELFDEALGVASRPGPRAPSDPDVRAALQEAIAAVRKVRFTYTDVGGRKTSERLVSPLGLVLGPRVYLVAPEADASVRQFALTGIRNPAPTSEPAERSDFDLRAFAERSFGAFHDGVFREWRLRFAANARHDLEHYRFHPSQKLRVAESGEVEVTFACESVREVAYECVRWSEMLIGVEPEDLRRCLREICGRISMAIEGK